jgi:enoyl-CoA hydratase
MKHVVVEERGEIALVRIARPPANALDRALGGELIDLAAELRESAPKAVVLTGSSGFFSAGLDLKEVPSLDPGDQREMVMGVNRLVAGWYSLPFPVVGALNGHAIAGGLVLALCADYRVGCSFGKIGLSEVRVGVPYPAAAIALVRSELAPPAARVLTLSGRLLDQHEAHSLGVLDEVVDLDSLPDRALAVADELGSLPARTYAVVKGQLRGELIEEIDRIIREGDDPLAEGWLSLDTASAAAGALHNR